MKKLLALPLLLIFLLVGCGVPETQDECLEQGLWKYDDACVEWGEIPIEYQDDVMYEVVVEIAESNNITEEEAMLWVLQMMDEVAQDME